MMEILDSQEEDWDSSDEDDFGQLALAYDPDQLSGEDGQPANGHDYLRLVQLERKALLNNPVKIPHSESSLIEKVPGDNWTSPDSQLGKKEDVETMNNSDLRDCDKEDKLREPVNNICNPEYDLKYRDEILANFRQLREKVRDIREEEFPSDTNKSDLNLDNETTAEEDKEKYEKLVSESTKNAKNLLQLMELGQPPQTSAIIDKSQMELHLALEKIADICEITPNYATLNTDWVYSLVACLREPIEPDICSTLRRLARICISRRRAYEERFKNNGQPQMDLGQDSKYQEDSNDSKRRRRSKKRKIKNCEVDAKELVQAMDDEEYNSSLLIICIVRHYFGQTDLK